MIRTPRSRSGTSGQGLVEFALVLPILATLLFGIIQFGITFGAYNGLINSVREAARYGSVCIGGPITCGPNTLTYLTGTKIPGSVFGYKGTPTATIQYQTYPDAAGKFNVRMRVTACADSIFFFPLIGTMFHPSDPSTFPLRAQETFRVEGQPTAAAAVDIAAAPAWTTAAGGSCS
jgi:TadE-like protein